MKILKILIALIFVGSLSIVTYVYISLMPPNKSSEPMVVEIQPGKFSATIQELSDAGVISSKRSFVLFAKFSGMESKVKTGEYEIRKNMWPHEILNIFISGKSIQRSFTVSEGLNIFDIAQIFQARGISSAEDFMNYVMNAENVKQLLGYPARSLEGYLYPETYSYTKSMKLSQVIRMMVNKSKAVIATNFPEGTPNSRIHQMMTLASIIEKETGAPEERRTISAVFHNRMKKKMRLQTDPTVLYGMAMKTGVFPKNIRRKDLTTPTAYNTYTIAGLPPGPIANPGEKSIQAALDPEDSDYLFFVSMNEGRHYFSKTYKEHNEAVRKYQIDRRAREGKSWRNMKTQ